MAQKRMLTVPNSKLGKADIVALLRQPDAWDALDEETQQKLWDTLPAPPQGQSKPPYSQHPLDTAYKSHIEAALRRWQEDLKEGRETKAWRAEAMEASRERVAGAFDDWKEQQREVYFGQKREVEGSENMDEKLKEP